MIARIKSWLKYRKDKLLWSVYRSWEFFKSIGTFIKKSYDEWCIYKIPITSILEVPSWLVLQIKKLMVSVVVGYTETVKSYRYLFEIYDDWITNQLLDGTRDYAYRKLYWLHDMRVYESDHEFKLLNMIQQKHQSLVVT